MRGWIMGVVVAGLVACDDGGGEGAGGGGGDACPEASSSISLETGEAPPAEAPAGTTITLRARLTSVCGDSLGTPPDLELSAGRAERIDEADGWSRFEWTLAPIPVPQRARLSYGPASAEFTVAATPTEPIPSADFGGVAEFLAAQGVEGTTEDLALTTEALLLPAPGGIVEVGADGTPTWRAVPALQAPLGIAVAADQHLWVVDADLPGLLEVAPDGTVTEHLSGEAPGNLDGPNHLAFGPDGKIYLSDPCAGRILRYDPVARAIDAELAFDRASQGGPNGVAFGPDEQLYTVTENTVVLCGQPGVAAADAPLAHVFRAAVTADGFGALEQLTDPVGTFGDGLAFDQDGNLFFVADAVEGLRLAESAIFVLPFGARAVHRVAVAPEGIIYANVAFGIGAFGDQILYISLLSVPPFAGAASRGVHALPVEVTRGPIWQ